MAARISDTIKKDHYDLDTYYKTIINTNDPDEQQRFQNKFVWELARHAVGEELVVYPAMEKYLRDGLEMADKDRHDHQIVKEQLKRFQDMHLTNSQFIPTIKALMKDLRKHIEDEEQIDLVKLESAITPEESQRLSKSFSRTKMFVPTRAHPSAPNKPPYQTAYGLMTAPVDQLMDMFRAWPEDVVNPNPSME
ncbi:hypothetical protein ASPWEDRAFT_32232 [Aspergillus wentii DTO 134E9]|uniref:Hemerythrin-like domain-containing protein n=1 Tax=Aspergillus wentii DTO 134E9 TaxID=1073089 RepID=A0A1L9R9R1_ASPWE|nr:uncharacterized protein ASPWEDRAFT_32232 [Aspergillus wentii DTO 134E9]KAI9926355.1 hypothetical protein MW887_004119 [Aspergillus wentii]OJJ31613.1 hypothetical protein ASPWEDRAFT_32232 [Aspergillus wentii DTO 134E9]